MKTKRDPIRVVLMWAMLLIYGGPTAFMVLCWMAGVSPFSWLIFLWGSAATAVSLWFGESRS